jgi:hypothetical protein
MMDDIGLYSATEMFSDKRAMMATTCLDGMETHLGKLKEIECGIVPMPKMTGQAEYRTYVHDQLSCLGIARSVTDKNELSMLGAVMESVAYHSNRIVRSAYYADALGTRVVNDPQARGMLGLLYETATFDFACSSTGVIDTYIRDRLRPLLSTNEMVVSTVSAWRYDVSNSLITINSNMG